jgi:hypothetical protein
MGSVKTRQVIDQLVLIITEVYGIALQFFGPSTADPNQKPDWKWELVITSEPRFSSFGFF